MIINNFYCISQKDKWKYEKVESDEKVLEAVQ